MSYPYLTVLVMRLKPSGIWRFIILEIIYPHGSHTVAEEIIDSNFYI